VPNKLGSFLQNLRRAPRRHDTIGKIDPWSVRSRSLARAERLGYPVNTNLPLIDAPVQEKSADEVLGRALCLLVVMACADGFAREKGLEWLEREGITDALSPNEREFLHTGEGDVDALGAPVESLWTFLWALRVVRRLNFAYPFDDDIAFLIPNLEKNEPAVELREKQKLRPLGVIFQQLDLAYCLHWAVVDAHIKGHKTPGDVHPSVIYHRLRALEWLVGTDPWDEVVMDT
jgi:hypothetical protein